LVINVPFAIVAVQRQITDGTADQEYGELRRGWKALAGWLAAVWPRRKTARFSRLLPSRSPIVPAVRQPEPQVKLATFCAWTDRESSG